MAEPKHKGVGILAVVKGIKANPRAKTLIPELLHHYLAEPVLPSGWYPERDYNLMIELLARHVDRSAIPDDVWVFFGRTAAQRDIAGEQGHLPTESRTQTAGIYRKLRIENPRDLAGLFLRLEKIWGLYHDSGRLTVTRHPEHACTAIVRISGFRFPFRGLVDLQTGFMTEYARLVGVQLTGRMVRSVAAGLPFCEWHFRVQPSAESGASIGTLPAPHPSLPLDAR